MELLSFQESIDAAGWAVTGPVISADLVEDLRERVAPFSRTGRGGARNLLDDARIALLAASPTLRRFATAVLGESCFAVRALFFDETPDANWKVVWPQDLTVAVQQRFNAPGYGPWTDKGDAPHVQPPVEVLEHMLAIRRIEYAAAPLATPLVWHRQIA